MISFSIVINTHDRADKLEQTLHSLAALRYPAFEVVVVNGPSADGTAALLARWADHIKRVDCAEANLSLSRNLGIAAAAGEVIAFLDDDAMPHPDWLRELSYAYADPRVGGVGGFTLDHTGVRFQARKHVCDRYGNAFPQPDEFDERTLNRPGTALYPSLLGTNSSFRATALRAVDGFDPVFAYFLDETDLCLRLVDQGWRVVYAAEALVFHQFAPSALRDARRVPRSILKLAVSKSYFIHRHGARASLAEAGRQKAAYLTKMQADNARLLADRAVDLAHRVRLDSELLDGLAQGEAAAYQGPGPARLTGAPPAFKPWDVPRPVTMALFVTEMDPWLDGLLRHLAENGVMIHLLRQGTPASSCFHHNIWHHVVPPEETGETLAGRLNVPRQAADRAAALGAKYREIGSFGIDVTASTLRALPGMAAREELDLLLEDGGTAAELAAHPAWRERPLFTHFHCGRLIALEEAVRQEVPCVGEADGFAGVLARVREAADGVGR